MKIQSLDLKAQYEAIRDEINAKLLELAESQMFILGREVEALEEEMAQYCGADYAVGVSSGSDALIVSLMALGIGRDDVVVTTPFTFFATAGAAARVGARIVFTDINPDTYNMDPQLLESLLQQETKKGEKTRVKAVIPVHLYGQCADMDSIRNAADAAGIPVIEDAAQAVGADCPFRGETKKACAMSTMGTLSFFPSKNLGAFGDGGMVITGDKNLAETIRAMRMHGESRRYFYDMLGGNFRLDSIQAAVLRIKLKYLSGWLEGRREKADYYRRALTGKGLVEAGLVALPEEVYRDGGIENYHTYHQYVIRSPRRDELQQFLMEQGIRTAIYYPLPLHLQKCFSDLGYREGDFPVAEKASHEVLALPIYPELTSEQQDYIVEKIAEFHGIHR